MLVTTWCIVLCMFQVVAQGLPSAHSVYGEWEGEHWLSFLADGTKDDNPLWSPYQLLTCSDDSKHTASHSVSLSLQSSKKMLKFSWQSELDHNGAVAVHVQPNTTTSGDYFVHSCYLSGIYLGFNTEPKCTHISVFMLHQFIADRFQY